ncbi:MAG: hypothetical protein ACK55Z_18275, partial [bacterium]
VPVLPPSTRRAVRKLCLVTSRGSSAMGRHYGRQQLGRLVGCGRPWSHRLGPLPGVPAASVL